VARAPKGGRTAGTGSGSANGGGNGRTVAAAKSTGAAKAAASRREQRRLQHQDLSRTQLLDAAEDIFGTKGFHDTTLKEIAELAEFSVGSVYSFFENKDDLFLNVFLRRGTEFMPELHRVATEGDGPRAQLHAIVDFEVQFFRRHPHFGRLYLRSASVPMMGPEPPVVEALAENFAAAMHVQADVFARGHAAGELRAGDPEVLARLLSGLIYSYQSLDPAAVGDGSSERMPLEDLHAIIDGAFAAP
jgi:AcrR family transcriptional regulator